MFIIWLKKNDLKKNEVNIHLAHVSSKVFDNIANQLWSLQKDQLTVPFKFSAPIK